MQKSNLKILKTAVSIATFLFFGYGAATAQQFLIQEGAFNQSDFTSTEASVHSKIVATQNYDLYFYMNFGSLATTQSNGEIWIQVPGQACSPVKFRARDVEYESESQYDWYGTMAPQDSCECSSGYLMLSSGDFGRMGQMSVGEDLYDLIPLSSARYILARYDNERPGALEPCTLAGAGSDSISTETGVSDRNTGNCDVRCLILYTPAAMAAAPNIGGIANFSINQVNAALKNSAVTPSQLKIVLAEVLLFGFTESGNIITDVAAINANPVSDSLRRAVGADIVVLFTNGTAGNYQDFGGFASGFGPDSSITHAIVQVNRAIGSTYTFSHEVGHLFGARHEITDDPTPGVAHGWGFRGCCGKLSTIMRTNANNRKKILHYSNPSVHYCNEPTGEASEANNAAVIRAASCTVANFTYTAPGLTARFVGYHDIYACACDNTYTVAVEVQGGSTGIYTFEWFISDDGINWTSYPGSGNSVHVPVPCNVGDRVFVRAIVTSSDNQTVTVSRAVEAAYEWPGQEGPCARSQKTTPLDYGSNIQVFPNPSQSKWYIASAWSADQKINFQVLSASGQLIVEENSYVREGAGFFSISNTHLPKGVYFLNVFVEGIPIKTALLLK